MTHADLLTALQAHGSAGGLALDAQGVIQLQPVTPPTGAPPSGMIWLYSDAGVLKAKTHDGTVHALW